MNLKKPSIVARLFAAASLFFLICFPASANLYEKLQSSGKPVEVVETLDTKTLEAGTHRFLFNAGSRNTGEAIWLPVMVIKGANSGPRMLITAAVHGDELNGIAVLHGLIKRVSPETLNGTLILVPGVNQPGLNANNRHFVGAGGGGHMTDLNRVFPGRGPHGSTAERYVAKLWKNILRGNADYMIDLHTQTQGSDYPLFVFSDFRNAVSRQMAYDLGPDMIKNDAGQSGSLETTMMDAGVPAVTFEVGGPKVWQPGLISRAIEGVLNVMHRLKLLDGAVKVPSIEPYVGANTTNIYTDHGGFAYIHVGLKDEVEKGQKLATVVDAFGSEIASYTSPHKGMVLSIATDPLREPGAMLVRILH